jgi:hypothetical protein
LGKCFGTVQSAGAAPVVLLSILFFSESAPRTGSPTPLFGSAVAFIKVENGEIAPRTAQKKRIVIAAISSGAGGGAGLYKTHCPT